MPKMLCGNIKTRTQNQAENYLIVETKSKPKQLETRTSKDIYKSIIQYDNIKSRGEQICL